MVSREGTGGGLNKLLIRSTGHCWSSVNQGSVVYVSRVRGSWRALACDRVLQVSFFTTSRAAASSVSC